MLGRLALLLSVAGSAVTAAPMLGRLIGRQEELFDSYTYVVVGGGTAGLTVANRLSEDPETTVLVLEAGIPDHKECAAILQRCLGDTMRSVYDWNITTEPQIYLSGRRQNLPIGKALGGSSMLNGMMFDRGSPSDYDMWEDLGNPGWGWAGLLPYFKKSETFTPPKPEHVAQFGITYDPSVHGFDGYVQSGYPNFIYPQNSR
ncbi:GMC oxidoreductase-domain-containing protein [Tuber indicum]|nr:GMC oxidoreductase-domain-containing protein [Tuber indicum]